MNTLRQQWEIVPLSDLLRKSDEMVEIRPDEVYREVTVKLWGKGVVLRREATGTEIAATRRGVIRSGQLVLSRIDARNGALGIVPDSLDGAVVSNDFPSFTADPTRLLPEYLSWLSKTHAFVELCKRASEGTTNRVRLKENRFLALRIPIPHVPEQQRIVARADEIAAKIQEARGLRRQIDDAADAICRSIVVDPGRRTAPTPLRELLYRREPDVEVDPSETYHFAGVYSFGRGVFRGDRKLGVEFSYGRLTQLRTDDFIYPKLMAWEGALGVVPPSCDGLFVSPEFPVFTINQEQVYPEVLDVYFRSPSTWPLLNLSSTGTNVRRRRLHPEQFLALQIPLPSRASQERLREVKKTIDAVKVIGAQAAVEMDALLPSVLEKAFRGEL